MERLEQRDTEALLSHLREIYVASDPQGFVSRVLSTLPELLPSDTVSYNTFDLQSPKNSTVVTNPPVSDHASVHRVFNEHIHEHPLINHYQQTGEGQAIKFSDFLTKSQWRRRALYNEFYKEIRGIEHQMQIIIPTSADNAAVAVVLGRSGKDFSERDRSLLDLLRPHLVQAHQNATALAEAQQETNHLRQAVEGSKRGMIALSSKDRMQWCNEQARRWVKEYFEPARGADRLPESLARWVEHQKSLLSRLGSVAPPREPLIVKQPGKQLLVRLVADVADDPEQEPSLLVLEERHAPLSVDSLQALGFTAREAEVFIHIAHGKTNKEIAATLHVSPRTVKTHLDNVYRKFGVTSRTEALSHALRVLDLLG